MRWWLNTDSPRVFSVDNAAVKGMDFSALEPDIWMVQWTEGKGEIERQDEDGNNLNGLREQFIDVIPYAPLFQQFLTLMLAKGLLLPQAKTVQIDLIRQIFESKRQAPFHYPVAAGDYWWDAADENMLSSGSASLQNAIASINAIVARLNSTVPALNTKTTDLQTKVNATIDSGSQLVVDINNGIVAGVNSKVVYANNAFADQFYNCVVDPGNVLITYLNDTVLGYMDLPANTVNAKLQGGTGPGSGGLSADIVHNLGHPFYALTSAAWATGLLNLGTLFPAKLTVAGVPWTPLTNVPVSNTMWIPFGGTEPVSVTPAESAAIMQGIAARSNDLNVKKNIKIGEVNAMTEIQDVIDYDVTIGW